MKAGLRARLQIQLLVALLATLLTACAGTGSSQNAQADDLRNSSDQSDLQRRAQIRLQLAVGYYGQGQMATALDEIKQALQIDPNFADAHG
ncbi:MAG: type IV pilus biogenesis/stability protein PilW, partial [Pseudomonadota bacterium]|nr:type IV pilus biogenesis/stability protein PilW [Pseudomonadota bacterium]